jgi:hypothetical protein
MTGMTRRRWTAIAVVAVVLVGCVVGWLVRSDPEPTPEAAPPAAATHTTAAATPPPTAPPRGPCDRGADLPFTPERITIEGVVNDAAVIGVPRDRRGVTGVLPEDDKVDFAWDRDGIRPGSPRGNVLLNTHTWPDGSAVGNAMLDAFDKGDRVVVEGLAGARLCYRVTRRIEVVAAEGYDPYYDEDGPPRLAFIVCSGSRSSAGEWSHRTIWFARPQP